MTTPTPPGLTVIAAAAKEIAGEQVRTFLEYSVRSKPSVLGVPMNIQLPIVSASSGPPTLLQSHAQQMMMYEKAEAGTIVPWEQRQISPRPDFDWTRNEGFQVLKTILLEDTEKCCISLHQHVQGPLAPDVIEGLRRIDTAARRREKHAMLFMTFEDPSQAAAIQRHVNNYIEIKPCEPAPGALLAFSIKCTSLRHLHALGIGHAMAQIKITKANHYLVRMERFLAAGLTDRVIAYMRAERHTLAEIAAVVSLNKSTVSRRLAALPSHWKPTPKDGWKDKLSGRFDFDLED